MRSQNHRFSGFPKTLLALVLFSVPSALSAENADSVSNHFFTDDVVIRGDAKHVGALAEQPVSYTLIRQSQMRQLGINSLKSASTFVANLYIPDYSSRLSSATYIRGVGSRSNSPAVGLYVDDVAYGEKSAFDFNFSDVTSVEVLRGPQSTLYGRNAMGGIIKITTYNPLETRMSGRKTEFRLGGSTKDVGRYANFHLADTVGGDGAFSFSGFYQGTDGYNRNLLLGRHSNGDESGGGKFRFVYNPVRHPGFTADFLTSLEYSDENGYDYYDMAAGRKQILENELGSYRRTLLNSSLRLESRLRSLVVTSVTGYQFLTDRMFMDQDFTSANIFTLEQRQKSHLFSEELAVKSHPGLRFEWLGGAYFSHQWLQTSAPVRFGADGIQSYIQSGIDQGFAAANAAMNPMGMSLAMNVTDRHLTVSGDFDTPVLNAAAFAQTRLKNILVSGLDLTAGLRLDYEHRKMDYNSGATSHFIFQMTRGGIPVVNNTFETDSRYVGILSDDYTQLLPRLLLSYNIGRRSDNNLVYASVSKGFRSGGYNIQMFSDLIQSSLRNDMMRTLAADPALGTAMSRYMTIADNPAADSATVFKPETSWNYELGTHLRLLDGHLSLQASLFYIRTHNQQMTRFAASGLGRQMVNAGTSESYGAELSLSALLSLFRRPLTLTASYGYTHATFVHYDGGTSEGVSYVYDGNHVPFAPIHNLSASAEYVIPVRSLYLHIGANVTAAGRVYWTEDNSISQPFYAILGAHVGADFGRVSVNFWGKNLTDTHYVPFAFVSRGNTYAQTCRPLQFGFDLSLAL